MLESIFVGMSGLMGYSHGLRVIANNTANLNTPGFKGSSLQFADMFYSNSSLSGNGAGSNRTQLGYGLNTYSTSLNFKQGELRQTGNDLDVAVDGQGLFILKDKEGGIHYTRAGQFEFDSNGVLVNRTDGSKVVGVDADNNPVDITLMGLRTNPAKATTAVTFNGNLSSTETSKTLADVKVIDASGGEHSLTLKFTKTTAALTAWTLTVTDGTTTVGTGTIAFTDGKPQADSAKVSMTYSPTGQAAMPLVFDFSTEVTSFAAGTTSTLALTKQDGVSAGSMSKLAFDDKGFLVVTYSNGETAKGARFALARFDSVDAVGSTGDNQFEALDSQDWHTGVAGTDAFGSVRSGVIEISNVDLSQEFSDLVIMQRGYQASSQIISTANDMLQELFSMKGK